jgi:hypothetical protein
MMSIDAPSLFGLIIAVIGTLVWFFFGRDRYALPSDR